MPLTTHNPAGVFPPYRSYSHAVEVAAGKSMPDTFEGQAEPVWTHLQTILRNAGMDLN